jgi:hypothetical protein
MVLPPAIKKNNRQLWKALGRLFLFVVMLVEQGYYCGYNTEQNHCILEK